MNSRQNKDFESESAGVKSINVKTLMRYSLGLSDSYFGPTGEEILNDWLKASNPVFTLNNESRFQEEIDELIDETSKSEFNINARVNEKGH